GSSAQVAGFRVTTATDLKRVHQCIPSAVSRFMVGFPWLRCAFHTAAPLVRFGAAAENSPPAARLFNGAFPSHLCLFEGEANQRPELRFVVRLPLLAIC